MPRVIRNPAPAARTVSATDAATIKLMDAAKTRLYVNLPPKPSTDVTRALIAAANRGVEVRVAMTAAAGHDSAWMLQQHLEDSGIDVDVLPKDPLPGTLLVSDDTLATVIGDKVTSRDDAPGAKKAAEALAKALEEEVPSAPAGLIANGKVALHPMPESSAARIINVIGAAKKSIDLEIYQLQDRKVVQALKDAAARGVKVRVMLEPKTVGSVNFGSQSKELKAAGIEVKETPPQFDSTHNVDHAKFMVIDGKEMLFGTGNLVRSGLGGDTQTPYDNRDFWVEDGRKATISEAQKLFESDWSRKSTSSVVFKNLVLTPDNADERITGLVDAATKRLMVYNQSLDDPDLVKKLIAAKQRGVTVQVLLGYQPGFGGPPKNQAALDELKAAGIPATYLKKNYLHAKAIVSDDRAYLGSQNFTNGGLRNNRELGEIFDDAKLVDQVARSFTLDASSPG